MDGPDHLAGHLTVLFEAPLRELVGDRRYGIHFIRHPEAGGVFVPNGSRNRGLGHVGPMRSAIETCRLRLGAR